SDRTHLDLLVALQVDRDVVRGHGLGGLMEALDVRAALNRQGVLRVALVAKITGEIAKAATQTKAVHRQRMSQQEEKSNAPSVMLCCVCTSAWRMPTVPQALPTYCLT